MLNGASKAVVDLCELHTCAPINEFALNRGLFPPSSDPVCEPVFENRLDGEMRRRLDLITQEMARRNSLGYGLGKGLHTFLKWMGYRQDEKKEQDIASCFDLHNIGNKGYLTKMLTDVCSVVDVHLPDIVELLAAGAEVTNKSLILTLKRGNINAYLLLILGMTDIEKSRCLVYMLNQIDVFLPKQEDKLISILEKAFLDDVLVFPSANWVARLLIEAMLNKRCEYYSNHFKTKLLCAAMKLPDFPNLDYVKVRLFPQLPYSWGFQNDGFEVDFEGSKPTFTPMNEQSKVFSSDGQAHVDTPSDPERAKTQISHK